jgi:hypothetical protein
VENSTTRKAADRAQDAEVMQSFLEPLKLIVDKDLKEIAVCV